MVQMQKPTPGPELPYQNGTHQESAAHSQQQGAKTQGAGPSMPLPKTEADHAALPVVKWPLQPGALVAYKLLEIGPDWAPQVFTLTWTFPFLFPHPCSSYQLLLRGKCRASG